MIPQHIMNAAAPGPEGQFMRALEKDI